uniref:CD209 molecule n=1 Tax=Nomascus leucogenys TaxID=61853 RepID=A0A2I3HPY6_NOMLE
MSDSKEPSVQQLGLLEEEQLRGPGFRQTRGYKSLAGCLGHGALVLQLLSFTLLAGLLIQVSKFPSSISQEQSKSNRFAWMGLSDLNQEGTWQWVDGSPLSPSFKQYWNRGEPNNIGEEDCAEFSGNGWNDDKCNLAKFWICKKSAASCSRDEEQFLSPAPATRNPPPA